MGLNTSIIPLGSCTMKLNGTSQMIPSICCVNVVCCLLFVRVVLLVPVFLVVLSLLALVLVLFLVLLLFQLKFGFVVSWPKVKDIHPFAPASQTKGYQVRISKLCARIPAVANLVRL